MPSEAMAVSSGPKGKVADYDHSAGGEASASAVSPGPPQNGLTASAGTQSALNSGTQYGANDQAAGDTLNAVMENLAQLGMGKETLAQVQQTIEHVIKNGADPNQVADALEKVLQVAAEQGVKDPNQILQALGETLQKIDIATAESKFQMVFEQLTNLGADKNTLQQLQQAIGKTVEKGIDPNQLADAMIQVLQRSEQQGNKDPGKILQALGQVLQQAAKTSEKGAKQAAKTSGKGAQQAA